MPNRTLPIIYAALLASIAIYGVLAFVMTRGGTELTFAELLQRPFVIPLYIAGGVTFIAAFFIANMLEQRGNPPQVVYITRWALLESVVIYGLVVTLINHDVRLIIAPVALALLGFVMSVPRNLEDAAASGGRQG
jgi:hypothetical protein